MAQAQRKRAGIKGILAAGTIFGALTTPSTAVAQALPLVDDTDGAIIVTARKREERLQDVPIAVSAISNAAIDSRGWDAVTDVAQSAPNVSFTPGQGGNSGGIAPFIRGVGENDFIITSDPAVGLYIDGVYVARTFGATTELLGIDRIEVLRGPQGSLFGKNTIGGAINVVSRMPDDTFGGEVDLRYGSYNTARGRALLSVPLGSNTALGLSVLGEFGEGWQKIPSGKNLGNKNVIAARAIVNHDADGIDVTFTLDGLHRRQNSAAHSMIAFTPSFFGDLQNGFLEPCCVVPDRIGRTDSTPFLNRDDGDAINANLTVSIDVGAGTLKSITGYRWLDMIFGRDGDASSTINYAGDIHDENARQFSQELQYTTSFAGGRGNLLVGGYFFRERSVDQTDLIVAPGLYQALVDLGAFLETLGDAADPGLVGLAAAAPFLDFNIDFYNRQITTNYAAFGNLTYDLTDTLTVEVGGRYTYERKKFFQSAQRVEADLPLLFGTPSYELKDSWENFSPRASLSYKFNPDAMAYVSWSRGFRSGGFNGRPTSVEEIGGFDPEKLTAWELGLKTQPADGIVINVAAFRNQYQDQQLLISTVSEASGLLVVRTENAGKSRIQGLEFELAARVSSNFRLESSLGLLDAKYQRYVSVIAGVPTDVSGRTPKQAPDITANLSLVYDAQIDPTTNTSFRLDTAYRSATYIDVENTELLKAPDHAIVNASVTFGFADGAYSLRFGADNIFDKRVPVAGYDARGSFGFVEAYYNEPRRLSVTAAAKF
ncbi:MAG: TonB-dependent receptor [Novosphingobium sp.]|nr:TonB-dependent receptor [Novosphingobium sp.]